LASVERVVVLSSHFDQTLQHNIPNLEVTVQGTAYRAAFWDYYQSTGGLARWGYPTSEVLEEETGTLTQYYQRGLVDWHFRADLGTYLIERRLAWDYFGGGLGGSLDQGVEAGTSSPQPGELLGPWGHKVSNFAIDGTEIGFLDFFNSLGGVDSFGYPKTEARADTGEDGTLHIPEATPGFVRQYFQAAVMEFHSGDPSPVKVRLLGDDLRNRRYPEGAWELFAAFNPAQPLHAGAEVFIGRVTPGLPPGQEQIAFASDRGGNFDIYVMDADGNGQTPLTTDPARDLSPSWSPDGSRIAFHSDRAGNWDIYVMNADGSGQTRLTTDPGRDALPDWSPDGSRIAFHSDRAGNWDIYVMNADGSGQTRLTTDPGRDIQPDWSPADGKIVFISNRDGNDEIYVMNVDGSGQIRLTTDPATDLGPSWSPDGSRITFASERDGWDVYVMNADGGGQIRLTTDPATDYYPGWSPDGSRITFASQRHGWDVYVMNRDGSGQIRLTADPGNDWSPSWSRHLAAAG
jgi:Tol biopolymer transport system component